MASRNRLAILSIMFAVLLSFLSRNIRLSIAVGVAVLIGGGIWLWSNRSEWKTSSEYFQKRTGKLEKDSIRWHRDSTKMKVIIDTLNRQAENAKNYAYRYKNERDVAVAVSDQQTDQLTDQQKQMGYLKALLANKTLANLPTGDLIKALSRPDVVTAGLKTANREAINSKALDSLALSIGKRDDQIRGLKAGFGKTLTRFDSLGRTTEKKVKGGLWPFNHRRRKELRVISNDAARIQAEQTSELERLLNQ